MAQLEDVEECVFCNEIHSGKWEEWKFTGIFAIDPLDPVTPGHKLFVPRVHVVDARGSAGLTGTAMTAAALYGRLVDEDFNLVVSSGDFASQTVPHLHIHYIPRRINDGLELPWTSQKRPNDGHEYRGIPGFPGYLINREGVMYSVRRKKPSSKAQYLKKDGITKRYSIGRLIKEAFTGEKFS